MYKTVFIEHVKGGYDLQLGKTEVIDNLVNAWAANGWELVTITPCPYLIEAARMGYAVTLKKQDN